jgi:CubicO group peptidase (beta-lactamase class C family)
MRAVPALLAPFLFLCVSHGAAPAPPRFTPAELARRLAPDVPPEGIATAVEGDLGRALDAWVTARAADGFSGAVLVARDGKVVLAKGYGMADREAGLPFSTATVFSVGSVTKQFTAAAIAKLDSEGKLSTADPLSKHLPGVPEDKRAITLHHLLTHTSGLRSDLADDHEKLDRDAYAARVLASRLERAPGAAFEYGNASYSLLAAVVERVSGMPYERYLRERLFAPAGMTETGYRVGWPEARLAVGYRGAERWGTLLERFPLPDGPGWALRGNGAIHTTLSDLLRWDRVLEGPLGAKVLPPRVAEGPDGLAWYGYGWTTTRTARGGRVVEHNGGNRVYSFEYRRYVDDGILVLAFSNTSVARAGQIATGLFRLATGSEPPPEPAAEPIDWGGRGMARVRAYFEAFNSGDVAAMRAFRAANFAPLGTGGPGEDERDARYRAMLADAGRLTVLRVVSRTDAEVVLLVRTQSGETARTTFAFAPGEEARIASLRVEI